MGTIDSIIDKATTYLTIYFVGLPFLMIYNYCAQIMRALGDSNKPLIILTISGIINVIFDLLFVMVFKLDVAGVAWATVISEAVSAILSILAFTFNKGGFVSFSPKKLAIDSIALREIVRIGLPAGLQGLAFSVPNVLIQSSLYTITNDRIPVEDIVNGSAASGQVEGYIYALIEALSGACVAFVGQNYGARKKENIRKVFWYAQIWSITANLLASLVCFVLANPLLGLFIHEADQEHLSFAIEAGKQRLFLFLCTYWLDGIMDIDSSYVRGMKRSTAPAIIIFFGCTVSRIIFLFTLFKLEPFHNVTWLYAAFPISWVLVDLVYIPVVITIQKKAFREIGTPSSLLNSESL
jgi:Na+-driven multidrug efflux pump